MNEPIVGQPIESVDTSGLESAVDRICETVDELRAQRDELLAALKDALAELGPLMQAYGGEHGDTICGRARAAIAKAEGRS